MQKLNNAKDVLLDPYKRAAYNSELKRAEEELIRQRQSELRKEEERRAQQAKDYRASENRRAEAEAEARRREAEQSWRQADREEMEKENAKKIERELIAESRGRGMGEKLASWIYTDMGRSEEKRIRDLLTQASKRKEGIFSIFDKGERQHKIDHLILGMAVHTNLDETLYGLDLSKRIRTKWIKEGLAEELVEKRFQELEQHLRELAHAELYDREKLDQLIPVYMGPEYKGRHDFNRTKIWNKRVYIDGFKKGWMETVLNDKQSGN